MVAISVPIFQLAEPGTSFRNCNVNRYTVVVLAGNITVLCKSRSKRIVSDTSVQSWISTCTSFVPFFIPRNLCTRTTTCRSNALSSPALLLLGLSYLANCADNTTDPFCILPTRLDKKNDSLFVLLLLPLLLLFSISVVISSSISNDINLDSSITVSPPVLASTFNFISSNFDL